MTTLVEKLRLWAGVYTGRAIDTEAIIEHAETLEACVAQQGRSLDLYVGRADRYRAALQRIVDASIRDQNDANEMVSGDLVEAAGFARAAAIASEALEEAP